MALSQDGGNVRKDRACPMRLSRLGLAYRYANISLKLGYAVILLVFPAPVFLGLAFVFAFTPHDPSVWAACVLGLIGISALAGAVALLVYGIRDVRRSLRLVEYGVPSLAKMVEVRIGTTFPSLGQPVPTKFVGLIAYTFQTAAGEAVSVERGEPPASFNRIHAGDRFLVLYDPVRPNDHEIDYFDARQADRIQLEAEEASTAGRSPQNNDSADRDGVHAVQGDADVGIRQGLPPSTVACERNDPTGASLERGKDNERLRENEPGQHESKKAALVLLRCVGALVLIIGGVWYWKDYQADIDREALGWQKRTQQVNEQQQRIAVEQAAEELRKNQAKMIEMFPPNGK